MKRILICLELFIALIWAQYLPAQTPVRIRFPNSSYSAILVGVAGSIAEGDTLAGAYNSSLDAHEFNVELTAPYKLYYDPSGGSSWSLWNSWGGTSGKSVMGIDIMNFAALLDSNNLLTTSALGDSIITLAKLTTAAINFISSGGSVTNNPDDVTLENKTGETIGVKGAGVDFEHLKTAIKEAIYNSTESEGKYPERKTVEFSTLREALHNGTSAPVSGVVIGEADHTETFNAATDSMIFVASNTHLKLPPSYKFDAHLNEELYPSDNTHGGLRLYGVHDVIIEGGEWDGNADLYGNNGYQNEHQHAIELWGCQRVILRGMNIHDWPGDCISIVDCQDILIESCYLDNPFVSGTVPKLIGRQCISIHTSIPGNTWPNPYLGIPNKNIIINACRFHHGGYSAIDYEPNGSAPAGGDVIISNNVFEADTSNADGGGQVAIRVIGTSPISNVIISQNTIKKYYWGMHFAHDIDNILCVNNTIDSCQVYGIYAEDAITGLKIKGNTISHCGEDGVYLIDDLEKTNIEFNDIHDNGKSAIYAYGYNGNNKELTVSNNFIYNNSQASLGDYTAVSILGTDTTLISGNTVYTTSDTGQARGIEIVNSTWGHVINNWCYGNKENDILFYGTDSTTTQANNRSGYTWQTQGGGSGAETDTSKIIVLGQQVDIPAVGSTLVKGEVHSNALPTGASDWGFMRVSAGGGDNPAYKAFIDLQGYSTGDANQVRIGVGTGGYSGRALGSRFETPLGLKIGINGTEIDSAKVSGGQMVFYNSGTPFSTMSGGPFLPLSGGTMTGNIALGTKFINGDLDNEGISISTTGQVTISTAAINYGLTLKGSGDYIGLKFQSIDATPNTYFDLFNTDSLIARIQWVSNDFNIQNRYNNGKIRFGMRYNNVFFNGPFFHENGNFALNNFQLTNDGDSGDGISIENDGDAVFGKKLGIKKTPLYDLDVNGNMAIGGVTGNTIRLVSAGSDAGIHLIGYANYAQIRAGASNNFGIAKELRLATGGIDRLTIDINGRFGLNTTTPNHPFDLQMTSDALYILGKFTNLSTGTSSAGQIQVQGGSTNSILSLAAYNENHSTYPRRSRIQAVATNGILALGTEDIDVLAIDASQNVSLTSTAPKLTFNESDNNDWEFLLSGGDLDLWQPSTTSNQFAIKGSDDYDVFNVNLSNRRVKVGDDLHVVSKIGINSVPVSGWELYVNGDVWVADTVSAGTVVDRCLFPAGPVTEKLLKIKGTGTDTDGDGYIELDHTSLSNRVTMKRQEWINKKSGKRLGIRPAADSLNNYIVVDFEEQGRDLGATVSDLIKGFQEAHAEREVLKNRVDELEKRLEKLEKLFGLD